MNSSLSPRIALAEIPLSAPGSLLIASLHVGICADIRQLEIAAARRLQAGLTRIQLWAGELLVRRDAGTRVASQPTLVSN